MRSLRTFLRDDRAVAPVVGFVLLFGIGVIAFSGYQAVQVPQQNAETEFQHYENVQNDLIVVRNAISRAGQQNQSQFESVRLGTQYRERALALNSPNPAGTLRTSEGYNITLDNGTDEGNINVTTRFLEYQNGYNELEIEPIYYENSVLYLDAESGQRVFFEDQNLVRDNGNTVVITALQREFSRSATGRVTLELYPTDGGAPLPLGEVSVTLPTQLPDSYWQGELAGEDPIIEGSYSYNERTDTVNQVLFTVESEDLEFNTVGINDVPDQTGAVSDMGGGGSEDSDDSNGSPEVFLTEYDDESNAPAPQNDSIPPENPKGTLQGFNNLQTENGARAQLSESDFGNRVFPDYQMNIGLVFRNIASGDHQITIGYQTGATGETFTLEVIDASGDEIDSGTDYMLDSSSMTTKTITLSTVESDYIDSNGEAYIRIFDNDRGGGSNGDSTQSSIFIDFARVNN